jgi:ubiquinone/menaquinone biosynthesis C-methylase UbiE
MSNSIPAYDRGKVGGHFTALSNRQDEAYVDYIKDARNFLHNAQQTPISEYSLKILKDENLSTEADPESVKIATDRLMQDLSLQNYYRVKRTFQDSFFERIKTSFYRREGELKDKLSHAEESAPGHLTIHPDCETPDYAKSEIHLQPGGNMEEDLAGYIYDHALMVFLGGVGDNDQAYKMFAYSTAEPHDGDIKRILDIGCGAGALTMALKEKYPNAELVGTDISAPLLKYAHKRAHEAGFDISYEQMPAEDMSYDDNSFDVITANLLFHELPVEIAKQVISEAFRVLRPGGVFHVFDFPGDKKSNAYRMIFVEMDAADNGEPYLPGFVRSNLEDIMIQTGFEMHEAFDPNMIFFKGRPAIKPIS